MDRDRLGSINNGLPIFVSVDQNSKACCKILNTACGRTGIMCPIKLVITVGEAIVMKEEEDQAATKPWYQSGWVSVIDSYFASL
jgi:hypothetical protein